MSPEVDIQYDRSPQQRDRSRTFPWRRSAARDILSRMRQLLRYPVMLALCACNRTAPTGVVPPCAPTSSAVDSTTHAQLVDARAAVWRAYYVGDSARLAALLPEPMIGMGATRADIIGWSAEFAHGRKLVAIEFTCDEFYVNGGVAVVFSNYRVEHELNGQRLVDAGRAIELFERRGGRWVNPSWHLDEAE